MITTSGYVIACRKHVNITPTYSCRSTPTHLEITEFEVRPEDSGLSAHPFEAILGGTPEENADAIKALLDGAPGAYRDIAILNAAATLVVADIADDLKDGAERAAEAIDSGAAAMALARLVEVSNRPQTD